MAKTKRKKKHLIRLELGIGGIFSLGIVCFCIFLWMFLLGVWAGQTLLLPAGGKHMFSPFAKAPDAVGSKEKQAGKAGRDGERARGGQEKAGQDSARPGEASFFSLQVAAFRDPARADKAGRNWRAKGYDTFVQPAAESSDGLSRVFIGKFEKLSDANALAAKMEKEEGVKAYIALLPASKIRLPARSLSP